MVVDKSECLRLLSTSQSLRLNESVLMGVMETSRFSSKVGVVDMYKNIYRIGLVKNTGGL